MFTVRCRSRLTAVAMLLVMAVLVTACGWPQYQYGPDHSGYNPAEATINPTNVSGLRLRWSAPVGGGAPVVIANGAVYGRSDRVFAFDANTGSARWSSAKVGPAASAPALANGFVYVSGGVDAAATLSALDATTGAVRWSHQIGYAGGSPTVAHGLVYVSGGKLYAFDAITGEQRWAVAPKGPQAYLYSPTVSNGVVFVTDVNQVSAFNAATGTPLWTAVDASGNFYESPAASNGAVFVSGGESVSAFNAATGARIWSLPRMNGYLFGPPAVANGAVYVIGNGAAYSVNAATGALLWSTNILTGSSSPAIANGVVYGGSIYLYALDATTGKHLWTSTTPGSSPVVADGVIYGNSGRSIDAHSLPFTVAKLSVSPAFAENYVFGNPAATAKAFSVANLGSTPTSPITVTLTGSDAGHFRLTSDSCVGTSLAGGATCEVSVAFAPTRSGARTARLRVHADAGASAEALLAGTAQPLTASPSSSAFGDVYEGGTSPGKMFNVTNLNDGPIGPIESSLTPSSAFTIAADTCAGRTLATGASCSVTIKFEPTFPANHTDTLVTRASGFQAHASLSGKGLARLTFAPAGRDFGNVALGTTASQAFTVANVGPDPVGPITDVFVQPHAWMSIASDTCAGRTLAARTSCSVVVAFAPKGRGTAVAQLTIGAPRSTGFTGWLIGYGK